MERTDAIMHAGAGIEKDNGDERPFLKDARPVLKGLLYALLIYGALAFFAEVVFASTVRGYANSEACCQDLASGVAAHETYSDEVAFHVRSDLPYYSYGGQCYAANASIQQLDTYNDYIMLTAELANPITFTVRAALMARIAINRLRTAVAAWIGLTWLQGAAAIENVSGPLDYVLDLNDSAQELVARDPCGAIGLYLTSGSGGPGAVNLDKFMGDCRKQAPPRGELNPSERVPVMCPSGEPTKPAHVVEKAHLAGMHDGLIEEIWEDAQEAAKKSGRSASDHFEDMIDYLIRILNDELTQREIPAPIPPPTPRPKPIPGD